MNDAGGRVTKWLWREVGHAQEASRPYRQALLAEEVQRVAAALLVITVLFVLFVAVFTPGRVWTGWPWLAIILASPAGCLLLVRFEVARQRPHWLALGTDAVYTLGITAGLLYPGTPTSGTALFVSVKLLASATLLPWHPAAQTVSAVGTLGLYWSALFYTGRVVWPSNDLPHQLTGPLFAALISVLAAFRAEKLRHRLFQESLAARHQAEINAQFAAIMSHELRNLLAAILGYTEVIRDGCTDSSQPTTVQQALDRQAALARHALDTIQVALALSRGGRFLAPNATEPLDHVCEALHQEFVLRGTPAGVAFRWDVSPDLPSTRIDGTKFKMIVRNLVDNALKFTPAGEVRVRIRAGLTELLLEVCDTGVGIPPEKQPFIFDPFERAAPEEFPEGVGLGLYITSRLVDALGGTIRVDSTPGKGSCFEVHLPLPPTVAAPSDAVNSGSPNKV